MSVCEVERGREDGQKGSRDLNRKDTARTSYLEYAAARAIAVMTAAQT